MILKGGGTESWGRLKPWFMSKRVSVLLVVVVILSIGWLVAGPVIRDRDSHVENLVDFTVRNYSSNQTLVVPIEVNLTDGMDRDEALLVTSAVFDRVLNFGPQYERSIYVRTAFESREAWAIQLSWSFGPKQGMSRPPQGATLPHGTFVSIIYAHNRTVVYEAHYGF